MRAAFTTRAYEKRGQLIFWNSARGAHTLGTERAGALARLAISPDGRRLLVAQALTFISECPPHVPCPTKPGRGESLALIDFDTGRLLWRRTERDVGWLRPPAPVFSPDGRFAVVELPSRYADPAGDHSRIGVVSMRDGRLLQEIPMRSGSVSLQLMPDGRTLVTQQGEITQWFDLNWAEADRLDGKPAR